MSCHKLWHFNPKVDENSWTKCYNPGKIPYLHRLQSPGFFCWKKHTTSHPIRGAACHLRRFYFISVGQAAPPFDTVFFREPRKQKGWLRMESFIMFSPLHVSIDLLRNPSCLKDCLASLLAGVELLDCWIGSIFVFPERMLSGFLWGCPLSLFPTTTF